MKMKHSPAPWTLTGWNGDFASFAPNVSESEFKQILGTLQSADGVPILSSGRFGMLCAKTKAEAIANAQLIAAAPELLDALAGLLTHYVRLVDSGDAGNWDAEDEAEVIAARAALASAKGGSK